MKVAKFLLIFSIILFFTSAAVRASSVKLNLSALIKPVIKIKKHKNKKHISILSNSRFKPFKVMQKKYKNSHILYTVSVN